MELQAWMGGTRRGLDRCGLELQAWRGWVSLGRLGPRWLRLGMAGTDRLGLAGQDPAR